jgi:hypothetical protein
MESVLVAVMILEIDTQDIERYVRLKCPILSPNPILLTRFIYSLPRARGERPELTAHAFEALYVTQT